MLNQKKRKIEPPLRIEIPKFNNLYREVKLDYINNIKYSTKNEIIKQPYYYKEIK
jgi:hypothetical protein